MIPLLLSHALLGCAGGEPAAPPPAPAPACNLAYDTLAGKTFVRQVRSKDGKGWEEDTWARARFYKGDGDKLKMKYNTRALVDMYDYSCEKGKGEILCLADNIDLKQWCQTLIANKGSCSAADLAELTGVKVEQAQKARAEIMPQIEKQTPEQLAKMKLAFSQPNNQLRGVMHLKVNQEECRITARDTFQTMTDGKLQELENYVGSSRFVSSDKDLVFEQCKDHQSLVALTAADAKAKPGEHKLSWKTGESIPFRYVNEALSKAEPGCTYSMDEYVTYEPVQKGLAVEPGEGGKLQWGFEHTFADAGTKVVHLYRYKACGGAEAKLEDVTCAMVKVE